MGDAPAEPDKNSAATAAADNGDPPQSVQPGESQPAAESQAAANDEHGLPAGRERRRYERVTVLWQASLQIGDRVIDCVIVNISASGAMVQLGEQVACRGTVALSNPKIGTFSAETVWHEDKRVGLNFNEDVEEVAEVLGDVLP
jgi:hypothetical protein